MLLNLADLAWDYVSKNLYYHQKSSETAKFYSGQIYLIYSTAKFSARRSINGQGVSGQTEPQTLLKL